MAVTTSVGNEQFNLEPVLTSIALSKATTIGSQAFHDSPLTDLSLPEAAVIGDNAFAHIVNLPTTHVTILVIFNTSTEKDRIFGAGH